MKIQTVSKDYFQNMIAVNKLKLTEANVDQNNIEYMNSVFDEFVCGIKEPVRPQVSIDTMLANLTVKMNKDLELIPMKTWKNIQEMCWRIRKYNAIEKCYCQHKTHLPDLINESLNLYKGSSKEFYIAAKQVLEDPNTYIYLNTLGIDAYYCCSILNRNFLACSKSGYNTYPGFIHELQHGIDFRMFPKISFLYNELNPMFFEILMYDRLNKQGDFRGIYGERINNHNLLIRFVCNYVKILEKFNNQGRKLEIKNASTILGVETKEQLIKLYNLYYCDDAVQSLKYIMSFMQAIRIRHIYYDSKKQGIKKLRDKVTGADSKLIYEPLIREYELFIREIEKCHSKKYVRRF